MTHSSRVVHDEDGDAYMVATIIKEYPHSSSDDNLNVTDIGFVSRLDNHI